MHQKPSIRYKCTMDKQSIKYNYKKDKSCFTFAIKVVKCSVWTCSNTQGSCQVIKELREARPASSTHNASALPHGKFVGDKYAPNGLNIGRSTTIVFIYCNDVSIIDHGTIQLRAFSTNPKMFRCAFQKLSIPFNNCAYSYSSLSRLQKLVHFAVVKQILEWFWIRVNTFLKTVCIIVYQ